MNLAKIQSCAVPFELKKKYIPMKTFYKTYIKTILNRILLIQGILLLLATGKAFSADPGWSVDPTIYKYQMTFVGTVYINAVQQPGTANIMGAFVNNQCRGVASPAYNATTGYWTYYLTTYSDLNGDTVKFKFFSSAEDKVYTFSQYTLFKADANNGSVYEPNTWSAPVLSGAVFESFSLPGQAGSEIIGNNIYVIMPQGVNITALAATYTTSVGAIVKIGSIVQQSTKSINSFIAPITYTVRSSEGSLTNTYSVRVVSNPMKIVATVYADTIEAASPQDTLYAYIRGQMRGKAVPVLNTEINRYRFSLSVNNPADTGIISFKFYSKLKNQTLTLSRKMAFINNSTAGTQYNPVKFSSPELKGKNLFTFSIPGQIGQTYYYGNEVWVVAAKGVDTTYVTPGFSISAGAIASISDSVQYSGLTSVKFSIPRIYKISASDLSSSQNYTVRVVSNSMNLVATVYADTLEAVSPQDTLYAYIHNQLRGKSVSVLNNAIGSRRFAFPIYNPTDTGIISFKFYSKLKNQTITLARKLTFINRAVIGTQYNPVKFSAPVLTGKNLFTFSIPGQIGQTYYNGNEIRVIVAAGADTTLLTPVFNISAGAIASVEDSVQYSAISRIRFKDPTIYKVSASDLSSSQIYTVRVVTYNERVIASVFLNSLESGNVRDTLYAYTNGFLLGKTSPVFVDSIKKYRYDIKTFSHTGSSVISFKYYNSATAQMISFARTLSFNNHFEIGTLYDPFELCNPELKQAELLTFSLPGQIGQTFYDADTVRIVMPKNANLSTIVPSFSISKGAQLKINRKVIYSGISKTDVRNSIVFYVYSSDTLAIKKYYLKPVSYEMNFIASVIILGTEETLSLRDTLFAYTNNFLLGYATPVYYDDIKKLRFLLKVNSHTLKSDIHFKYYEASTSLKRDLVNIIPFVNGKDSGTVRIPVILSNQELRGTEMYEYVLPDQIGETIVVGNTIKVILPIGTDLKAIVPVYRTLPGTHVMVNNEPQYSGITSINFETEANYIIYSSTYSDTAYYKVVVILNKLDKIVAPALISPNGDGINDFWTIREYEKLRDSRVYIVNSMGTIVWESTGYDPVWDGTYKGSPLPMGVYYYVIKSPGKIIASGTITLLK